MKIKTIIAGTSFLFAGLTGVKAQFTDFHNYPVTVTPHESPDSTRGHFWGYMFGNAYTKLHANDSGRGQPTGEYAGLPKGFNAFTLQRLYLGYDYFFNKKFSVHAVMAHEEDVEDQNLKAGGKVIDDQSGNRIFYLKYANMEWDNIFKGSRLTVGIMTTPSFAITEEPFWGYRSIDRTLMDGKAAYDFSSTPFSAIASSNDMGVNLGGKIWKQNDDMGTEKACIGYNVMVGNGTGSFPDNYGISAYATVEAWKKYYGDLYVKVLHDKLVLDIYGDGRTYQWSPYHQAVMTGRVFLGYKTKNFNIGVEYFEQIEENMVYEQSMALAPASSIPVGGDTIFNNTQSGFSVLGAAVLMRDKKTAAPKISVYAKYEMYNADVNYKPNEASAYADIVFAGSEGTFVNPTVETDFVIGFDYQPIKQIHFMPNIMYEGVKDRDNNLTSAERNDYDLTVRLSFYYQFFKN